MEGGGADSALTDSQALTDIQSYLVNFNKEISAGTGQAFILTSTENALAGQSPAFTIAGPGEALYASTMLQPADTAEEEEEQEEVEEDGLGGKLKIEGGLDSEEQEEIGEEEEEEEEEEPLSEPLLHQATASIQTQTAPITIAPSSAALTGEEGLGPLFTLQPAAGDGSVQVLQPGAAQATLVGQNLVAGVHQESVLPNQQLITLHNAQAASQGKLVTLQGMSPAQAASQGKLVTLQGVSAAQPQVVTLSRGGTDSEAQLVAADSEQQQGEESEGTDSYQTVTIMPSDVSQGGEVSYVLIVSQPDGDNSVKGELDPNIDMSVYDFKEEARGVPGTEDDSDDDGQRSQRSPPKKVTTSLQTQLMCNYCNYTSPKRYLLSRHMKTHSEERPHKCHICERGFKTVGSLQNHINTHTGVRPHKCKECDASFTTSGELVRHVRYRHTFEKPHKCTECDYSSVELSKLKRHLRSHTGERPYNCPHCSYASPDTYKLKRHLRIHTGEKPYECEICQARFTQSNSLKAHKLIHTGNKPVYQCELCPTTCGRKTDLKIHVQKLHTSDKPLQCKKCGKTFPDRYTWKIHVKTHEGEKCFKCELCPYAALSQRHLESHLLTHTGEKPFRCTECDQTFRQKQLLKRHLNLYHTPDYVPPAPKEKIHECPECHKQFAHKGNLLRHMTQHDPDNPEYQQALANLDGDIPDEDEEEEGDGGREGDPDTDPDRSGDQESGLGLNPASVAHAVTDSHNLLASATGPIQYANINGQQVQVCVITVIRMVGHSYIIVYMHMMHAWLIVHHLSSMRDCRGCTL